MLTESCEWLCKEPGPGQQASTRRGTDGRTSRDFLCTRSHARAQSNKADKLWKSRLWEKAQKGRGTTVTQKPYERCEEAVIGRGACTASPTLRMRPILVLSSDWHGAVVNRSCE